MNLPVGRRRCVVCGTSLPTDSRKQREYCSTRCRVAHLRAHKTVTPDDGLWGARADAEGRDADPSQSDHVTVSAPTGVTPDETDGTPPPRDDAEPWARWLDAAWAAWPHYCRWCGGHLKRIEASPHHLVPRGWHGSTDDVWNLALVHRVRCHDQIELWTKDHGRPPTPTELAERSRTGNISEPAVRYEPRHRIPVIDLPPGGLVEYFTANATRDPDGTVSIDLTWSPVAPEIARRLRDAGVRVSIREPRPGDSVEAFLQRNGLRAIPA